MNRRGNPAPPPTGSLKAKPILAHGLACIEGAFRRIGTGEEAEAERLLSMGLAHIMAAKAILEAHSRLPQD